MDSGKENKLDLDNKIYYKSGFFARIMGKTGWYVKSNNGRSHGPYSDKKLAADILFYDKYYG